MATIPGDPLHFQKDSPVVKFPVNGGPSNPHMSLEYNGEVLVSDLVNHKFPAHPQFSPVLLRIISIYCIRALTKFGDW